MCFFLNVKLLRAGAFLPAALLLSAAARTDPALPPRVVESYGKLPLSFEANRGQTDPRVKYLARGQGYTLFLTHDASAVLSLHGEESNAVLRMKLRGANARVAATGADELPGKSNYFIGNDPSRWRTTVPSYRAVKYAGVYPGIDLVYHGNQRLLEYDFVVAPGADPRAVDIRFQGARKLSVNGDGALVIGVGTSEVIEHAPVVYQQIRGQRQIVAGRYVLRGKERVGFSIAEYDSSHSLVIDPTLVYSTFLGGNGGDGGFGIAVDASGNAYITGGTNSVNFPTTPGTLQPTYPRGTECAFVAKLNSGGTVLLYSTFLGGASYDTGTGISVDPFGNVYVTGETVSSDFPTTPGAFQTSNHGGANSFVAKLNAAGSVLMYSTYLGGHGVGGSSGIAIDAFGNAYVTGWTRASDFPTTPGAFQTRLHGQLGNAFVTKLNAAGSALIYSTYLGGSFGDGASGLAVDSSGSAYIAGATSSSDFPTTPGAFQTSVRLLTNGNSSNAFVTKLNAAGSALIYSTYLGGSYYSNYSSGIAIDALGYAYVTGTTNSSDFPTTSGAFQTTYRPDSNGDPFVTKLNVTGSDLIYSTYLGLGGGAIGIVVDTSGNAYVTGATWSSDFPTTPDAFQTALPSSTYHTFLSKLNAAGSALLYSTYLGGSGAGEDGGVGIVVDASGNAYLTGGASEKDFPTTPGAFQTTCGDPADLFPGDTFVSKFSLGSFVPPGPMTTVNLSGISGDNGWYLGPVIVTLMAYPAKSPISATYYRLDNGPYQGYGAPFSISTDGTHQFFYYSVDTAGNQEPPHGQTINIDGTKPVSHVAALPVTATSPNFSVQWYGTDATSGLVNYTIYISDNGGPFSPWLSNVTSTQAYYTGSLLHTYAFYSIATDNAGNIESKTAADTITHVPQMPGDVNGDGKINCADITPVKASFGKRTGQTGFNASADLNNDGVVDVRDLSIVSQKLIPGTKCP